tara:strand:+ start:810 stop:959 length:150 start_codon:yes stop_codon:yes gene_type:complete
MSIEDVVYSAEEHGQRSALFEEVSKIRNKYPHKTLESVYEEAYQNVMKV